MYTAGPASGVQVDADTSVSTSVSGTPSATPLRPAKLDRISLRTTPPRFSTFAPFDPSPGYGPCVSSGILVLQALVAVAAVLPLVDVPLVDEVLEDEALEDEPLAAVGLPPQPISWNVPMPAPNFAASPSHCLRSS